MISIISAVGQNNEIGINNDLIWHIPNDLKFFKEKTTGHTIVMGSNTFKSLGRILPNRHHIVLSSKNDYPSEVEVYHDFKELLNYAKNTNEEIFIIGGAKIYRLFINYADQLYLTEINDVHEATAYFPEFNKDEYDKTILSEEETNGLQYKFTLYKRK